MIRQPFGTNLYHEVGTDLTTHLSLCDWARSPGGKRQDCILRGQASSPGKLWEEVSPIPLTLSGDRGVILSS